jgi:hypothetical protein
MIYFIKQTDKANQKRVSKADEFAIKMVQELESVIVHPVTQSLMGLETLDDKAEYLNSKKLFRQRGGKWDRTGIRRLILRVEKLRAEQ